MGIVIQRNNLVNDTIILDHQFLNCFAKLDISRDCVSLVYDRMMLSKNNTYLIYRLNRLLSVFQSTSTRSSYLPSTSTTLSSSLKKLFDSKQYKKLIDTVDENFSKCTNSNIQMAIKACSLSKDYKRVIRIEQKLSPAVLNNTMIQESLLRFYCRLSIIFFGIRL